MSELIIDATETSLPSLLESCESPVLLDLWAPWCGPCRALAPLLESVAAGTRGALQVVKLNVEDHPAVCQRLGVRGIPTLLLFRGGEEISRKVGAGSREELDTWLRGHDVVADPDEEPVTLAPGKWSAFHGDADVYALLAARLQRHAAAGRLIQAWGLGLWDGERGGVASALVQHASLEVFERVTALPPALGAWMNQLGFVDTAEVAMLTAALAPGKDTWRVPLQLVAFWLSDDRFAWSSWLDAEVEALRLRWLTLVTQLLAGRPTPRKTWMELQARACACAERSEADMHMLDASVACLVATLSPPAPADATQAWGTVVSCVGVGRCKLMQVAAGWSREELPLPEYYVRWLGEQVGGLDKALSLEQERMQALREQWYALHPQFRAKDTAFNAAYAEGVVEAMAPLRAELVRLLAHAPAADHQAGTSQ